MGPLLFDLPLVYFCHLVPSPGLPGLDLKTGPGHEFLSHVSLGCLGAACLTLGQGKGHRLSGRDALDM